LLSLTIVFDELWQPVEKDVADELREEQAEGKLDDAL
jgi:hypothetical protein